MNPSKHCLFFRAVTVTARPQLEPQLDLAVERAIEEAHKDTGRGIRVKRHSPCRLRSNSTPNSPSASPRSSTCAVPQKFRGADQRLLRHSR